MKPAITVAATPGRRRSILELAQEAERRGFAGLYCPSFGDGVGLCEALAFTTETIPFGTAIANLYLRHPFDYAQTASLIHELSGGRFRFGVGVSHAPMNQLFGVKTGKPLDDVRKFVADVREASKRTGELPPIVLATLRKPMVRVAAEIADGAVWANAARSHMKESLSALRPEQRNGDGFFVGNLIPTCMSEDGKEAAAVMRRTLTGYVMLPNYRAYWTEAGYGEEMEAIGQAVDRGDKERVPELMSDRWLRDVTLFGTAKEVREGFEAWVDAGVKTPVLVPSATSGGQRRGIQDVFQAFA